MAKRAGVVLGPREAARQNLDAVRSRGNPERAVELGRERMAERETHTERTVESGGKGGQALLVAFVLFAGWLFLTGRLQGVWEVLLMGPIRPGSPAPGAGQTPTGRQPGRRGTVSILPNPYQSGGPSMAPAPGYGGYPFPNTTPDPGFYPYPNTLPYMLP